MKQKRVKGWACIEARKGYLPQLEYDWVSNGDSVFAVFPSRAEAEHYQTALGEDDDGNQLCRIVVAFISYPLTRKK